MSVVAIDSRAAIPSPAAHRAIRILEEIRAADRPLRLTDLARVLECPKLSVHNLLVTLESLGMVRAAPDGWRIGIKALEIGAGAMGSARAAFRRLVDASAALAPHTVLLSVLDGSDIVCVARHEGREAVRLSIEVGDRMPAVVTALGKAMVAALSDVDREAFLDALPGVPQLTRRTHPSVAELRRDLDAVRHRGYAVDYEQNTVGITCFAVDVPGASIPTAVAVTLPTQRVDDALRQVFLEELARLAAHEEVYSA